MICLVLEIIFCALWIFLFPWRIITHPEVFTTMSKVKNCKANDILRAYNFKVHEIVILFKRGKGWRSIVCPQGRSGHRIVSSNSCLYSFGGFHPNADDGEPVLFRELWQFNLVTRRWRLLPISPDRFPSQLASMAKIEKLGDKILIHGGTGLPFGYANSDKCYVADLAESSIDLLEITGDRPSARYGHASFYDRQTRRWYVVGGTCGTTFFMDVFYLDLMTRHWTRIELSNGHIHTAFRPQARYRHEIAVLNNKIIVFGGGTLIEVFSLAELPVFDVETAKWDIISTIPDSKYGHPENRFCHSGLFVPGEDGCDAMFVISGGINQWRFQSLDDLWSLNLRTWQWYRWRRGPRLVRLPTNLHFHDASLTPQGQMIIFGGVSTGKEAVEGISEGKRSSVVFSCWVKIPPLAEMAWEAVLKSCNRALSSSEMVSLGIPRQFMNRTETHFC